MRIETIDPEKWEEYMSDVLVAWEDVLKVKQEWLDNPNPTNEFVADIRVRLSAKKDNMVDTMRSLVLCKGEWDAIIHTHREESMKAAMDEYGGKVTAAEAVYRGYDPYNTSLKISNALDNMVKICYAKIESVKDLTNAMSAYTKDIYHGTSIRDEDGNLETQINTSLEEKYNKTILF